MRFLRSAALAALVLAMPLLLALPAGAQGILPGAPAAEPEAEAPAVAPDEAVTRLLEVLRDDEARAALIARLEAEAAGEPAPAAAPAEQAPPQNLAQRLASATAEAIATAAGQLGAIWREFTRLELLADRLMQGMATYRAEALAIVLTIVSTVAVYTGLELVLRRLALRLQPRVGAGIVPRARATAIVFAARLLAVALAWFAGYMLAAGVFGSDWRPSSGQSLYLNAFAVLGVVTALLRTLASPSADTEPSLSTLAPGAQAVIFRNLRVVAGTVIQGFLFVVPLVQNWAGFFAGRPAHTLVASIAAILGLLAIRRISRALALSRGDRGATLRRNGEAGTAMAEGAQSVWRKSWPPLAIVYVLYSWFVAISQPNLMVEVVLEGTAYTAAGLGLLLFALRLLRTAPEMRAPLPRALSEAAPRLGPRLDRIASAVAFAFAAVLMVAAVLLVFAGWEWGDIGLFLSQEGVQAALWRLASAALVALAAAVIWAVVASWIDRRLALELPGRNVSARSRTLLSLFRNAFTVAIAIFATMIALSQLGIDIAPLLAGAGVIGLAIGFGAQKLVQDIITGIFIQLENAMNEGDVVGVAGITGGVEKITIRSVKLRTLDGAAHVVPFSSVDTVTNLTRDFSYHVAEIGVAYKEKLADVKAAMEEAFVRLRGEGFDADILEPLEMHGITQLGDSAVVVRARIKTLPGKQWGIGRRYTELVKEVLDERGIEIPFPHRQLVLPPEALPLPRPARTVPDAEADSGKEGGTEGGQG